MREPQGRSEPATSRRSSARPGSIADDQPRTVLTIETRTFLFTDVEGSTDLVSRLGPDDYAQALSEHHGIVRDALAAYGGTEEGTQGDSFFATFTSTSACVAAAIQTQHALSEHDWPNAEQLRVRMGVHAGEASEAPTGLVGYEVHRAARIGAVAHGGQVLLSASAAGLVEDSLPAGVALGDLGTHRLKDLGRPEHLYQLVALGCARRSLRCAHSTTQSCRTTCRSRSARSLVVTTSSRSWSSCSTRRGWSR